MPIPIILGIAAGIAAIGGIGVGINGGVKMKEANDTMQSAKSRDESNMKRFEIFFPFIFPERIILYTICDCWCL